jgi:ABC-type sugar transport system substrate-binding protein
MTLGALEALRLQDLLEQATLVGLDANPNAADAIVAGEKEASFCQAARATRPGGFFEPE